MPSLSAWELHQRILAVVGTLAFILVAILLSSAQGKGLDGLGAGIAGVALAFATVSYLAVSTILANMAKDRRGIVLAHVATPLVMVVLGAILFGRWSL